MAREARWTARVRAVLTQACNRPASNRSGSRALAAIRRQIDCPIAPRAALPQMKGRIALRAELPQMKGRIALRAELTQPQEPAITWLACCTALTML